MFAIARVLVIAVLFAIFQPAQAEERSCITGDQYESMWSRFQAVDDTLQAYARRGALRMQYVNNRHRLRVNERILRQAEAQLAEYLADRGPFAGTDPYEVNLRAQIDRYQNGILDSEADYARIMHESDRISRLRYGWAQALGRRTYSASQLYAMRRIALRMRHDLSREIPGLRSALTSALAYSYTNLVQAGAQYGCTVPRPAPVPPDESAPAPEPNESTADDGAPLLVERDVGLSAEEGV